MFAGFLLVIVIKCLSFYHFVVAMAMVVMGGVCTNYHGHTHYYQATIIVLSFTVTMAMVVIGGMCVQSITAIRTIIRLLCWK